MVHKKGHFYFGSRVSGPSPRQWIQLLGPCFKTGDELSRNKRCYFVKANWYLLQSSPTPEGIKPNDTQYPSANLMFFLHFYFHSGVSTPALTQERTHSNSVSTQVHPRLFKEYPFLHIKLASSLPSTLRKFGNKPSIHRGSSSYYHNWIQFTVPAGMRFQVLLIPITGCFSTFPRGTCLLSDFSRYLALEGRYLPLYTVISHSVTRRRIR
jgi:hypothetical protein